MMGYTYRGYFVTIYVFALLNGILTFISPCILPLIPVYLFFLAGNRAPEQKDTRLFLNTLAFIAGFSVVFTLLGTTASALGSFLNGNTLLLRRISGSIMMIMGLNFLGITDIGFLNKSRGPSTVKNNIRFINSLVFGIVFAAAWSPCLTAFLGSLLLLASNQETVTGGSLLLLTFSAGLGIPFLVTSLLYEKLTAAFVFIKKNYRTIKTASGILMIAAGLLVFFDYIKYLSF
jgi:cytochrome c-type biogenesis protein